MGRSVDFNNRDRLIQLGIAISTLRRMRGLSQDQLSDKSGISRTHLSNIEAPGIAYSFSMDAFFSLADALEVDPADLINAAVLPDKLITGKRDS